MQPALLQLHPQNQLSLQPGLCCCYLAAPEKYVAESLAAASPVTYPGGSPHQAAQHFKTDNTCVTWMRRRTYFFAAVTPASCTVVILICLCVCYKACNQATGISTGYTKKADLLRHIHRDELGLYTNSRAALQSLRQLRVSQQPVQHICHRQLLG